MKRTIPLVLVSLFTLAPVPAHAQLFVIEGLNELGNVGQRIHDNHIKALQEARRLKKLEAYREAVNAMWRETTPAKQKLGERLATAKTALAAKRQQLRDYLDRYGAPDGWPPEHQDKAKALGELERSVAQLESVHAQIDSIDVRARKVSLHMQDVDQRGFAEGLVRYNQWAQDLEDSIANMRQTLDGFKVAWQPSAAPPLRVKNDTRDVSVWVNGQPIPPGQSLRISAPTGAWVTIFVQGQTERRKFVIEKGQNPTRHTSIIDASPYVLAFDLDAGAGNTRTVWQSHDEVYRWVTTSSAWKVVPEIQVAPSGEGPQGDVVRFKVPYIAKDRFGADGWQSYPLCFHGELTWTMTRTGEMARPPQDESEKVQGGCVVIDVFSS